MRELTVVRQADRLRPAHHALRLDDQGLADAQAARVDARVRGAQRGEGHVVGVGDRREHVAALDRVLDGLPDDREADALSELEPTWVDVRVRGGKIRHGHAKSRRDAPERVTGHHVVDAVRGPVAALRRGRALRLARDHERLADLDRVVVELVPALDLVDGHAEALRDEDERVAPLHRPHAAVRVRGCGES